MRSARLAVVLDVGCVLVFVIIGRASHTKGESLAGVASTAWPFLAGLAGGWLATLAWLGGVAAAVPAVARRGGRVAGHGGPGHGVPGGVRARHRARVRRRRAGVPRPVPARLAPAGPAELAQAVTRVPPARPRSLPFRRGRWRAWRPEQPLLAERQAVTRSPAVAAMSLSGPPGPPYIRRAQPGRVENARAATGGSPSFSRGCRRAPEDGRSAAALASPRRTRTARA